jgi:hypothetical protein
MASKWSGWTKKQKVIGTIGAIVVLGGIFAGLPLGLLFHYGVFSPGLPEEDTLAWYACGYGDAYSLGVIARMENWPVYWVDPDHVNDINKQYYIPRGYMTEEDVANLHFPDGSPYNRKQKKQALEQYNWGFYFGFRDGAEVPP